MWMVHHAIKFNFLNGIPFLKNINHISCATSDAVHYYAPEIGLYILEFSYEVHFIAGCQET